MQKQFGILSPIKEVWIRCRGKPKKLVMCQCLCGKNVFRKQWQLKKGISLSCGCLRHIRIDGKKFGSVMEAWVYLQLKKEGQAFSHDKVYDPALNLGKKRYDFHIPSRNEYVEVTSFDRHSRGWPSYQKGIMEKMAKVASVGGVLNFIQRKPSCQEAKEVWEAMDKRIKLKRN